MMSQWECAGWGKCRNWFITAASIKCNAIILCAKNIANKKNAI
jgi:hypothetical protein